MALFKRASTYGMMCTFLLAAGGALIGLAQSRRVVLQHHPVDASCSDMEAALRTAENRMWTKQNTEGNSKDPWTDEQLMLPEELLKQMSSTNRPLVLHIGVAFLFKSGHIVGSKYVGQASTNEGLEKLKKAVQEIPLTREIVLCCGCCPWKDCPNIRPAFRVLRELRFTKVKLLYLPTSFVQDWVEKGLPVEKGEGAARAA